MSFTFGDGPNQPTTFSSSWCCKSMGSKCDCQRIPHCSLRATHSRLCSIWKDEVRIQALQDSLHSYESFISRFRRSKLVFDVVSLWPCCAWGCMGSGQPFHFMVSKYPILSDPCWWNWAWDVYDELGQVWGKAAVCCQQCFSCLLSHVSLSVIDIEQCYFRRLSYTPEIHDGSPRKSHKQYTSHSIQGLKIFFHTWCLCSMPSMFWMT